MKLYRKPMYRQVQRERTTKPSLLIVEDNDLNLQIAQGCLGPHYDLHIARNAKEACALLQHPPCAFHAILMDIELQGSTLDGVELTRHIRGLMPCGEATSHDHAIPASTLPILYLTAHSPRYTDEALALSGGNRCVTKPIDFIRLRDEIESLIGEAPDLAYKRL